MYTQYIFIHIHRHIIYLYPERDRDHIPFKRMELIYMIMHAYIFIHNIGTSFIYIQRKTQIIYNSKEWN